MNVTADSFIIRTSLYRITFKSIPVLSIKVMQRGCWVYFLGFLILFTWSIVRIDITSQVLITYTLVQWNKISGLWWINWSTRRSSYQCFIMTISLVIEKDSVVCCVRYSVITSPHYIWVWVESSPPLALFNWNICIVTIIEDGKINIEHITDNLHVKFHFYKWDQTVRILKKLMVFVSIWYFQSATTFTNSNN